MITLLSLNSCTNYTDYNLYYTDIEVINNTAVTQYFSIQTASDDVFEPEIADRIYDYEIAANSSRILRFSWIPGEIIYSTIAGATEETLRFSAAYVFQNQENNISVRDELRVLVVNNSTTRVTIFDSPLKKQYSSSEFNSTFQEPITNPADLDIITNLYWQSSTTGEWTMENMRNNLLDPTLSYEDELAQLVSPVLTSYSIQTENSYISIGEDR